MSTPYTDEQIKVLEELMPRVLLALSTAHDAARGYGYTGPGVGKSYDISPAEGLAKLKALDLGGLLDQLNDWCWCESAHRGPCEETTAEARLWSEGLAQLERAAPAADHLPEWMNRTHGYPPGWRKCRCGLPTLDGHLTCGRAECDTQAEAERRG